MTSRRIVMDFTTPPTSEDILAVAEELVAELPSELTENIEKLVVEIDDFPDQFMQDELDAETPFDLLGVYISTAFLNNLPPHVQAQILQKTKKRNPAKKEDILRLYRRPILDAWCETEDHLTDLIRHVIVREIAYHFDFSEEDITRLEAEMQEEGGLQIMAG